MCKPTTDTLFLHAQHQLSTDFNRTEEIEPEDETEELRKAQDGNAAASRARIAWIDIPSHKGQDATDTTAFCSFVSPC